MADNNVPFFELLPTETWMAILEALDSASLSALCYVSSRFKIIAQPILFQSLWLELPEDFEPDDKRRDDEEFKEALELYDEIFWSRLQRMRKLEDTLRTVPHLARAVTSLTLTANLVSSRYLEDAQHVLPSSRWTMKRLVNLRSLTLEGDLCDYGASFDFSEVVILDGIRELVLHCSENPSTSPSFSCGLHWTEPDCVSFLEKFEWTVSRDDVSHEVRECPLDENPIRYVLTASRATLTTISFPFYSDLPQDIIILLYDLTFPQLSNLSLGPYAAPSQPSDLVAQETQFTKFIDAHPLLELLDLSYATNDAYSVDDWRLNPDSRPKALRLQARYLTSTSLPRLRRFRGNIESVVAMEQAAVSSLTGLEELGIAPPTKMTGSPPDFDYLSSALQNLLSSPRRPRLRVLHMDLRWDRSSDKASIIEALTLCAQLWGDSLETWAGVLPINVELDDSMEMGSALGLFRKLKIVYLQPQSRYSDANEMTPEAHLEVLFKSLSQAVPTLERVRVETSACSCPLADSRTRGSPTWREWRVLRKAGGVQGPEEDVRFRRLSWEDML